MIHELVGSTVCVFYANYYANTELEVRGTLVAYENGWLKVQSDDAVGVRYINQAHVDVIVPILPKEATA